MVLLMAAIKIHTHMIPVMTAQALAIIWPEKGMVFFPFPRARQLAFRILKMTGCTARAVPDIGVIIPCAVHMAAQALTTEQVIDQLLLGLGRLLVLRDLCQVVQGEREKCSRTRLTALRMLKCPD